MAAPKGNRYWEARSSHGRKPIFTPETMLNAAMEYLEWVEQNPLLEEKAFHYQGEVFKDTVQKMRPATIGSLIMFMDIGWDAWYAYKERDGFAEVTQLIENAIREQKFAGAAADMLNANIIARDLGLADRQERSGPNGGPIEHVNTIELVAPDFEEIVSGDE